MPVILEDDRTPLLTTDSALRKEMPITMGMLKYFPKACAYVARISYLGNEKHNPGEPLHWARGKSMDQEDCMARHLVELGIFDPDDGCLHDGKLAWRALANLQLQIEERERLNLPVFDEEIIAANREKQKANLVAKQKPAEHPAGGSGQYEGLYAPSSARDR